MNILIRLSLYPCPALFVVLLCFESVLGNVIARSKGLTYLRLCYILLSPLNLFLNFSPH